MEESCDERHSQHCFQSKIHATSSKETADDLAKWIADIYPSLTTKFEINKNEMSGLFLQDAQMKSSCEKFPDVILIDATHKTSDTGFLDSIGLTLEHLVVVDQFTPVYHSRPPLNLSKTITVKQYITNVYDQFDDYL